LVLVRRRWLFYPRTPPGRWRHVRPTRWWGRWWLRRVPVRNSSARRRWLACTPSSWRACWRRLVPVRCAAVPPRRKQTAGAAAGAAAGRGSWRGVDAWTMRCGETHQLNLCAPEPTPAPERTSSPGMRRATPTVGFAKNHHRGDRAALTTHALHAVRTWQAVMIYS
jgi:hypothetical protein